jgi:hypothetical protein
MASLVLFKRDEGKIFPGLLGNGFNLKHLPTQLQLSGK